MSGFSLFPRSLRQLVLLAFILVLLPLLVLAYQAYKSLDNLSSQALNVNRTTLSDTQRSENMTNIALGMERSYRQYCVLDDKGLVKLYQNQRQQYKSMLIEHASTVSEAKTYQPILDGLLEKLATLNCEQGQPAPETLELLQQFSQSNMHMVLATRESIFLRGEYLQQSIAERGAFVGRLALLLFLLSLLLVVLFTRMIIGPVKRVKEMIDCLGEGRPLKELLTFQGPQEIQVLAQRIVWLSERLAWLEAQRHEFLRHISHELKTPLASMREGTELLADQVVGTLTKDQKDVVDILDNSSRHLQRLIEQLLDYNRRLADLSTEKEQIDLTTLIKNVVAAHSLPARSKSMVTECKLDVTEYWGEATLLVPVVDNIYSNAVHYGAESGTIWVTTHQLGNDVIIDIANTGDVIPAEEHPMLFEPFYQGSKPRKGGVKGSGLGLSIAQDCIHRMKGTLQIVDVDYADVCFRIKIPLTIVENN